MNKLDRVETASIDIVAKIAPWFAPVPTAYLVGRATVNHLSWPPAIGVVAAIVIESLGLATTATALELYQYNQCKRKVDTAAPFHLALVLVVIYFIVATGLTIALDIFPNLASYAPAIFPALSLTGVTVIALRSDHSRRIQRITDEKTAQRDARQAFKSNSQINHNSSAQNAAQNDVLGSVNRTRQARRTVHLDSLLKAYQENPTMGITEAAKLIGVHRNTIYNYTNELIKAGRLHKNGHGWEVVK